jgi:hypothetical protein
MSGPPTWLPIEENKAQSLVIIQVRICSTDCILLHQINIYEILKDETGFSGSQYQQLLSTPLLSRIFEHKQIERSLGEDERSLGEDEKRFLSHFEARSLQLVLI